MGVRGYVLLGVLLALLGGAWLFARTPRQTIEPTSDASVMRPSTPSAPVSGLAEAQEDRTAAQEPPDREALPDSDVSLATSDEEDELAPTPERPGPGQALLRVQVVGVETGKPLAGAELALFGVADEDDDRDWDFSAQPDPARGVEGDDVRTDEQGRGEFIVRAGVAYELDGSGPDGMADEVEQELEPLREGEEREVRLALPTAWTFDWHARVIDGESELALVGAEVIAYSASAERVEDLVEMTRGRTIADGRLVLRLPAWEGAIVRCQIDGYFPGGCKVKEAAASFETAQSVVLRRPAALVARVIDARGQPGTGLEVQIAVTGWQVLDGWYREPLRWSQSTDGEGRCEFRELPSAADVFVTLRRSERVLEWTEMGEALQLVPGERREIEWRLPEGVTLTGRVRDGGGQPLGALALFLKATALSFDNPVSRRHHLGRWLLLSEVMSGKGPVVASTTTDDEGRFSIESVPPGSWLIGPKSDRFPAVVQPLVTRAGEDAFLELVLDRPEHIRGAVLDPDGRAVAGATVACRGGDHPGLSASGWSERDGAFLLGPLLHGRYFVQARSADGPWLAPSEEIEVETDGTPVSLPMRWGGQVHVTALDDAGAVLDGISTWWFSTDGQPKSWRTESVPPGVYTVGASTQDGRIGFLRNVVVAAKRLQELTVTLAPGARIELRTDGRSQVEWEGLRFQTFMDARTLLVPTGTVNVRRFQFDAEGEERMVANESRVLAAGEVWRVGEGADGR